MRVIDLIIKKRNNKALTTEEIKWLIDNYTNGNVTDYQMSAFLMAVCFNGLTDRETALANPITVVSREGKYSFVN